MRNTIRFVIGAAGILLLALIQPVQATTPTYFTLNCNTAVHLADFVNCAYNRGGSTGPGIYVTFGSAHFTQVTVAAFKNLVGFYTVTSAKPYKSNGSPALTDADLDTVNSSLFSTIANKKGEVFNIDPSIETSYIGSEDALIDSRAVSNAIGNAGLNPAAMAVGTVVMVQWKDGTTAQFVKISNSTLMWSLKPGSAKNAKGEPIDANGNVTGSNLNGVSSGLPAAALPNFSSIYLDPTDWGFWLSVPNGTVTIECGVEINPC
jgi:hypothetical protein